MNGQGIRSARWLVALTGMIAAGSGNAITIEGLPALTPVSAPAVSAIASNGRMDIRYAGGSLNVSPWPDFLPANLSGQTIHAERQLWPGGPVDRLAFSRLDEDQPWLIIGSHSRISTPVVGAWKLEQMEGAWYLSDGVQTVRLPEADAAMTFACIVSEGKRWRVYMLPEENGAPAGLSPREQEPFVSWVAVQG